ncbi:isoleucine--tRNA ligase 1 [Halolactibacillus alkaliphilus]|uniref:Isoleucine--tRNA ligase n=1 Tax=Halolactibacillus alkaliphilus TaxID=442899 RepID=A0A511WYM6_9BACI|nr:isoleucine--tRNA ligase [Halolactibacillus alkaliphilus]GEN55713.1 isoleucine--tRNA ligase 1 [Halolactibacillus alkaliphilus]GGN65280.1 isoleucine--tRNA ligase 1 [Halolactibacillus alkaliphilus]SFO63997.1 Isoleucyl-tRNA synthetase [Halolactibacillus alkaliphilus]
MEYKQTLLMPKTEFPMRGNLPNKEPKMQETWDEAALYDRVQARTAKRPLFVLHDGPPYANGDLHMGHALNKILKDFIVKFKSMSGFNAPYVPGWDTHGLPIENALQKKKVDRKKLSSAEFREKCAEYALKQVDNQRTQFKQLGVRGDWDNPYVTLDKEYEAAQIKVFGEMAKKGYIYKGLKPVYWSPSSESALAEAEIEYQDKRSASIYVAFPVKDGGSLLDGDEQFLIWTTTPWTIPSNLAIALHADLNYVVVQVNDEKIIVAEALLEKVKEALEWTDFTVVKTFKGKEAEHLVAKHPLYDRDSLIILGEHVTTDGGTGLVHTAPGHGEDDFIVGKKYGLDVLCPVNDKGVFTKDAPGFEGLFYDDANKLVTEKLEEVGALKKLNFITHAYPHDWRTKKPVIYRATNQWFASIKDFRDDILAEINRVNWIPKWGETRLFNMVRDREDWCISRQRIWGVPIPVFYGEDQTPIITDETIAHVANLFKEHGSNVWFEREAKELLPEGFTSEHSPNGEFTKEMDIMDVWFDSGSSHEGVLEARHDLRRPADLYLEGSDQYRGWFNSSLSTSVAVTGRSPYESVLSHGFALDGQGRKMSKSVGNVVLPSKIMKQYGADILRLWVASVDYQADVRVSDDIIKQTAEGYRKIRNTFRFLLGNINDFDPMKDSVSEENLHEVDRYMLIKLQQLIKTVTKAYNDYDFQKVYNRIHQFCSQELSAFYLDFAKDILYIEAADDQRRRAIQTVYYETVVSLTKLITPILTHTAEEVWPYIPCQEAEYVQLTDMPEAREIAGEEALLTKWDHFLAVRDDVLKALEEARAEKVIGKSLEAKITIQAKDEKTQRVLIEIDRLDQLFIVSKVELVNDQVLQKGYDYVAVSVEKYEADKCERCWVADDEVGKVETHSTLCPRCAEIVSKHYQDIE